MTRISSVSCSASDVVRCQQPSGDPLDQPVVTFCGASDAVFDSGDDLGSSSGDAAAAAAAAAAVVVVVVAVVVAADDYTNRSAKTSSQSAVRSRRRVRSHGIQSSRVPLPTAPPSGSIRQVVEALHPSSYAEKQGRKDTYSVEAVQPSSCRWIPSPLGLSLSSFDVSRVCVFGCPRWTGFPGVFDRGHCLGSK